MSSPENEEYNQLSDQIIRVKRNYKKDNPWVRHSILIIGLFLLSFAVYLENALFGNLSVGILFLGILFIFLQPGEYVDLTILNSTILSYYNTIFHFLDESQYEGIPVYYSTGDLESMMNPVIVISKEQGTLKNLEASLDVSNSIEQRSSYTVLTPPGSGLMRLIEHEIDGSFTTFTINFLGDILNKTILAQYQLVEAITFEMKERNILITMKGNKIYYDLYKALPDERIHKVGDIITSAIACIITKITLSPVIIKSFDFSSNNLLSVEYEIIKKESYEV